MSIAPRQFRIQAPRYQFRDVKWHPNHPPETFSFARCRVVLGDCLAEGYVYYPHPETKVAHFQDPSTMEIITRWLGNLPTGRGLELVLDRDEVEIVDAL